MPNRPAAAFWRIGRGGCQWHASKEACSTQHGLCIRKHVAFKALADMVRLMAEKLLNSLRKAVEKAVAEEGLRGFSQRTGVSLGIVRGALRGQNLSADSIARLVAALGLDLRIEPAAGGARAARGFAEPAAIYRLGPADAAGWARLDAPAPPTPFFVEMPEPLAGPLAGPVAARFCLVDPGREPEAGALAYVEDREGRVAVGRLEGCDPATGWIRLLRHGAAMRDERAPESLARICAITWVGVTPPGEEMATLASARRGGREAIEQALDEALAELRARLGRVLGESDGG